MKPVTRLICVLLALAFLAVGCSYTRCQKACLTGQTACPAATTERSTVGPTALAERRGCAMAAGTARVVPLEGAAVVRMTDNLRFDPATVTIQSGQTVQWINDARQAHTVIDDPAVAVNKADAQLPPGAPAFNSDKIEPGRSYVYTFTVPGTYRYFCGPHEGEGMVGEVIVQ